MLPKLQVVPPLQQNDQIEQWLHDQETFTARELEEYLNRSKGTVRKIIESLMKEHRILRVGNGPSTNYIVKNKKLG